MVADFAKAMGKFAKTDAIDATVLAEFGSRMRPELTTPAPEELRALEAINEPTYPDSRDDYDGEYLYLANSFGC